MDLEAKKIIRATFILDPNDITPIVYGTLNLNLCRKDFHITDIALIEDKIRIIIEKEEPCSDLIPFSKPKDSKTKPTTDLAEYKVNGLETILSLKGKSNLEK